MHPSHRKIRERILYYEERYPEFPHLSLENEVAMIYGWGRPVIDFQNYTNLKELLERA